MHLKYRDKGVQKMHRRTDEGVENVEDPGLQIAFACWFLFAAQYIQYDHRSVDHR